MDSEPLRNELLTSQWYGISPGLISYTGGNVGIGTIRPTYTLDVFGTINAASITITSTTPVFVNPLGIVSGGTGASTALGAFNALSPMTTLGDIIYGGTSGSGTRLPGSTSSTIAFLSQTGTGTVSAAPAWTTSTGTGSVVLSASPSLTGTTSIATLNLTNALGVIYGGTGTTTSTGTGSVVLSASPTLTGTISCAAITSSGGTIQTSFSQGTNAPSSGQAYFYNPSNSANQDASCGVRIAGSTARNAYYSLDVAGVAGYSWGITGSSQNLVYKASWDFSSTTIFTMDRSGNFTATGNVTAGSDARLKKNIEPIENALEKVSKINGYTFDRIDIEGRRFAGVLAQEMLEVLPEVVHTDDKGMYSVSYGNIVALLIEAVKELKQEVENLKAAKQ